MPYGSPLQQSILRSLNPYTYTGFGTHRNEITGRSGTLNRTSATTAAFSDNTPAEQQAPPIKGGSFSLPPSGPADAPGEVPMDAPGKVPTGGSGGALGGLSRATDGGGYGVGDGQNVNLRGGLGYRTPPSLAALLQGLRY